MTGGLGYFYDETEDFPDRVNAEIVNVHRVRTAAGEAQLKSLITDHVEHTGEAAMQWETSKQQLSQRTCCQGWVWVVRHVPRCLG